MRRRNGDRKADRREEDRKGGVESTDVEETAVKNGKQQQMCWRQS